MSQLIFAVIVNGVNAELEISKDKIICTTENTVHFNIQKENVRNFIHTSPKNIMINFFEDEKKYQVNIKSKYCSDILKALTQINQN